MRSLRVTNIRKYTEDGIRRKLISHQLASFSLIEPNARWQVGEIIKDAIANKGNFVVLDGQALCVAVKYEMVNGKPQWSLLE